jgi:hypothetical protein
MTTEKIVLRLATPHGDYYDITESGNIVRLDIPGFSPSGQWKFLGLSHVRRSEFIPFSVVVKLANAGKLPARSV